jgi:calcium-dependent protein kinase
MLKKSNFIGVHKEKIDKYYRFIKELGHGSFGKVYRCQRISTGDFYACKKFDKKLIKNKKRLKTEINLLRATDHPNIIKLYEAFEDKNYLYLIMEECTGGELFLRLVMNAKNNKLYTEKDAAKIMKQILEAVNYLHCHGVCHRDLKPENILLSSKDDFSQLKLIDFSLSQILNTTDDIMKGQVGTLYYMAPEVILGNYNEKCDVWSCGVILYILLSGNPPFFSKSEEKLKQKICKMKYNFDLPQFSKISQDAKNLIRQIFVDRDNRPTIADVLNSTWVKGNAPNASSEFLNIDLSPIMKYSKLNLVQKSVINFRAFHMTTNEAEEFINIFKLIDKNSDGVLTFDEIKNGIQHCKFSFKIDEDIIVKLFNDMDIDKNGLVNYTEFVSALMDYEKNIKIEHLIECFQNYDEDNSGKICFKEFCNILRPQNEEEKKELKELYDMFDNNGDGEIDIDEFIQGFKKCVN